MVNASDDNCMLNASQGILRDAMHGVKAYHNSTIKPFKRDMDVIVERNGSRLLSSKSWAGGDIVILIPSLINSWKIFDIEQAHSFCDYLASHGMTPYIVEWARPDEGGNVTIDDYIVEHLSSLINAVDEPIKAVIGYCMGATFIPAVMPHLNKVDVDDIKVIMIAPPWDFSYQSPDQMVRIQSLALQTHTMTGVCPHDFVQSLFWAIDPLQVIKKFRQFPNIQNVDRFVRVEDWLNDKWGVSKSVLQTCLFDWYRDNKITKEQWKVRGEVVDGACLDKMPVMIVKGAQDTLVPPQSSMVLEQSLPKAKVIEVDTGHIGLMASNKAVDQVWKPIVDFVIKRKT